jgi:hypothetical protein
MKRVAKILKVVSILFTAVLILLFSVSVIMQNKVGAIVLKSLNNSFSTKIVTGSYRLSLIKKFPRASVELKNVIVYSSPDFDRSGFAGINTDTLLFARSASIDFKTTDMLKGAYTFTRITISSGNLNLFTDTSGHYNYDVSKSTDVTSNQDNIILNFDRINLSDVRFVYNDLRVSLIMKGRFKDGKAKSKVINENIDFDGKSAVVFDLFQIGDNAIKQSIPADLEVGLNQNEKGIFFRKSTLRIENWDFILTGYIAADGYQDLNVTAPDIDISKIINLLPEKYRKIVSDFHPAGNMNFEWLIKGKPTRSMDPHYDIKLSLRNARIESSRSKLKIERLSFDGSYTNGNKKRAETSMFSISNFTARLGSADYTGSLSVSNFSNPRAELVFKGKVFPAELKDFMNLRNVSRATGSVDLNLRFSGYPGIKDSYEFSDLFDLDSQSEVKFNSAGISFDNLQTDIRDVNGRIIIRESTVTDNFTITVNKQKMIISGKLLNFPGWLAGNPVNLTGTASFFASSLRPEFFMKPLSPPVGEKNEKPEQASVTLPDNVLLETDFKIDTLVYKSFNARNIKGTLSIKPGLMNFRSINLSSQKGTISGNGLVVQNRNRSFTGRGSFILANVDVNEAFTTFHNFGQDFLRAENIAGSLSGSISMVLPADSLLNPDIKSIIAEGKYTLTNGTLINFDPVRALSRFIKLSELENIKFARLENDFFIRNNVFYVPQMEIKSSAVDLSVNGKHSFDNDYQYHVKMLLSEILSNKARNNKTISDEFGEVEDDGLGRTSVFLLIDGKGEEVKVSYDMKAAGNQIREDMKKEKQVFKTIINEEYGLYKSDTAPPKQSSRRKFRIAWEGSDTAMVEREPPVEKKENVFRKIFKKK